MGACLSRGKIQGEQEGERSGLAMAEDNSAPSIQQGGIIASEMNSDLHCSSCDEDEETEREETEREETEREETEREKALMLASVEEPAQQITELMEVIDTFCEETAKVFRR